MYFTTSPASSLASSIYSGYSSYSISPSSSDCGTQSASCAFPSWPRRSSLNGVVVEEATSFISDDDLFPDVFDENESDCTPIASPSRSPPHTSVGDVEIISFTEIRNMLAMHKELQPEKKRRKRRSSSSSSKKSKVGPPRQMSPIQEVGE